MRFCYAFLHSLLHLHLSLIYHHLFLIFLFVVCFFSLDLQEFNPHTCFNLFFVAWSKLFPFPFSCLFFPFFFFFSSFFLLHQPEFNRLSMNGRDRNFSSFLFLVSSFLFISSA